MQGQARSQLENLTGTLQGFAADLESLARGDEPGGGLPPLLAQPAPLRGGRDEDSGMQLLAPAHNDRPRVSETQPPARRSNHDESGAGRGRCGMSGLGCGESSMPSRASASAFW